MNPPDITIIGRGHSGTRAMSHTLSASAVFMGQPLNESGDLVPPDDMYEACRVIARYVEHHGGLSWDFSKLHTMPIDPAFPRLIESYLASVLGSDAPRRGWKIPETTLCFPWIVRLFPDIKYIYWVRDPRDCILSAHVTDDLSDFGVPYDRTDDVRLRRAISWSYQAQLVRSTPKPKHWITAKLEDFVCHQDVTLHRLGQYLGFDLAKIAVKPEVVGRHRADAGVHDFDFFQADLAEHGYPREYRKPQRIGKAFVMSVNKGAETEYEKRHSPIWPQLEQTLKDHGVHNYSIFLHPQTNQLFAYVEIEDEARWATIAQTDICRKWWAYMGDVMPSNPDNSPVAEDLGLLFHID
jgi:L-rhamnose mutarotase